MKFTDSSGQEKVFRLLDKIAPVWERVGVGLGVEDDALLTLKRNHPDVSDCVFYMMKGWLDSGPVTWSDLLQALEEAKQYETARELKEAKQYETAREIKDVPCGQQSERYYK